MTESERSALSQAIRETVISQGNYSSIVREAAVRQPVVSHALHRRLVVRTEAVNRLFEYLLPNWSPSPVQDQDGTPTQGEEEAARRRERLIGMLDRLSDGSDGAEDRLASVLAAIGAFAGSGSGQRHG